MLPTRTSALTAFNLPLRFAGLKSSDYVCCNDGVISTGPHEIWHIEYRHIYVQYPSTTERAPCWFSYPQYQVLRLRARKNLRPVVLSRVSLGLFPLDVALLAPQFHHQSDLQTREKNSSRSTLSSISLFFSSDMALHSAAVLLLYSGEDAMQVDCGA